MRTIRTIEVQELVALSPFERCLDLWVRWQERSDIGVGWRGRSTMLASDGSLDSEQLYDSMDNTAAVAVDAMIASLSRHHAWAIQKRCGITSVWRYNTLEFAVILAEAAE